MSELDWNALHRLISKRVRYQGKAYAVIELIEDIPAIVLQEDNPQTAIQADTHGFARRRVSQTLSISILNSDHTELSQEFLQLQILD